MIPSHARKRLFLVSPLDGSARPLTEKLLERPRLLARIRDLIPDPDRAHLVPYNTTELERDLAVQLGIPMYGADPQLLPLRDEDGLPAALRRGGRPASARRRGSALARDVVDAIAALRAREARARAGARQAERGRLGRRQRAGRPRGLPAPGATASRAAIEERVAGDELRARERDLRRLRRRSSSERGGIVEERISGEEFRSPSVQLRVTPLGEVELLSTHDQLLGGPSGQSYLGCRFPADPATRRRSRAEAAKVGERLAREGVIGRFALDFVTVRDAKAPGSRTRSRSTCARAARRTRSSRCSS